MVLCRVLNRHYSLYVLFMQGASSSAALIGGGAAAVAAGATSALKSHKQALGDVLDDYMGLRLVALEEKVRSICDL
jgi:hypothetical protein